MGRTLRVWNDDEKNAATVLFRDGVSATDAAAQFSQQHPRQISRSAMIGAWHRLGLNRGHSPATTIRQHKRRRSEADVKKTGLDMNLMKAINGRSSERLKEIARASQEYAAIPSGELNERTAHACDLFGLNDNTCRWPIGHPGDSGFFFCGRPDAAAYTESQPYCPGHSAIAYGGRK